MLRAETRSCQNCKSDFTIEPEDFSFYEKIKVPPPTFCPECRLQRRLAFRNERGLHRRKSDATGKDIISIFRPDSPFTVYESEYYYSDNWDAGAYGKEYDFSKPFFEQFKELLIKTPTIALFDSKSTNSSYCNITVEHKNCYLASSGWSNEDCMYINRTVANKNSLDLYICSRNEYSYDNIYCKDSYKLFYSHSSENCNDCYFLYDCRGCSNCFGCVNLRNKQYYIFNQPYSKEEYFKKLAALDCSDYAFVEEMKHTMTKMRTDALHRYAQIYKSVGAVGDHLSNVKNAYQCFDFLDGAENVKYSHWSAKEFKDSYDTGPGTGGNSELLYEGVSIGVENYACMFGFIVWYSRNVQYAINCQSSNDLFGCVSLRNKSYCILNKQYTKEGYEALLPKVIQHMHDTPYTDSKGRVYRYGESFPVEFSPGPYNDTVAQEYMPITKTKAVENGFGWGEPTEKTYQTTVAAAGLPLKIDDVSPEILKEIIGCAHQGKCDCQCSVAFRITSGELEFYKQMQIPLPRLCFNCRHQGRLSQRNPMKLWKRNCLCDGNHSENNTRSNIAEHFHGATHCPNIFNTTFAPDRQETVYCEQCYQAEVV